MKMLSSSNSILLFSRHRFEDINVVFAKFIAQIYDQPSLMWDPMWDLSIFVSWKFRYMYMWEIYHAQLVVHCWCIWGCIFPQNLSFRSGDWYSGWVQLGGWSPLPWDDTHTWSTVQHPEETSPALSYNQNQKAPHIHSSEAEFVMLWFDDDGNGGFFFLVHSGIDEVKLGAVCCH